MRVLCLFILAATFSCAVYSHPPGTVSDGYAGGELRSIKTYRTESPPKIDGVLDDLCWSAADSTTTLYNERSFEPCTQQTIIRTAYDNTHLYFAFECLEQLMEGLRANERRDDRRQMFRDDLVQVKIDTFHDHRTCYSFVTNAAGAKYDTREGAAGRSREAGWNCEWTVGSSRTDDRWFVEMAIPLDELLFDRTDGQTWGVNFMRDEIRLQEEGYWSLHNDDLNNPRRFGHLEGLDLADAVPTSRFKFEPYVSAMLESNGDEDFDANVGIDVTYKLTSDLTSAFTVNPDFGQVETDADDIRLRDVERFLPERRPYFKEGLELFDTPYRPCSIVAAYSISITARKFPVRWDRTVWPCSMSKEKYRGTTKSFPATSAPYVFCAMSARTQVSAYWPLTRTGTAAVTICWPSTRN